MGAEKIGGLDRHASTEDRIDLSVTKLARLIGRRMAREMFEAEQIDDDASCGQRPARRSDRSAGS